MNAHITVRALLLVSAASAVPTAAIAAENTYVYENVSGWTIRTDVDRDFRCYAEAEYINGSVVRAGFNSDDGSFYLSVGNYSWDWVEEGGSYEIAVGFDDGSEDRFAATGTVIDAEYSYPSIRFDIPGDRQQGFIRQFMDRREMTVSRDEESSLTLGLNGTRRATRTLDECRLEMVSAVEEASSSGESSSASLE